jgi:stage II sporulation protein D
VRARALVAVLAAALVIPLCASSARAVEKYDVQNDQTFTFVGRGYGHGRGMSQYGAFHAASIGQTATQITNRYYSASTLGTVTDPQLLVRLERSVNDRLAYFPTVAGLTARDEATGAFTRLDLANPGTSRWRVVTDATGLRVQRESSPGVWVSIVLGSGPATSFAGPIRVFSDSTSVLRVQDEDEAATRAYRGNFRVHRTSATAIAVVNVVTLEAYLRSVVPSESPASWPAAALQAQAIAARSYSLWHQQHPKDPAVYDICDTQSCQVYSGTSTEDARSDAAIVATKNQARVIGGQAIRAEFASTNGGWTETGGPGHSPAGYDSWTDGSWDPFHQWQVSFTASEMAQKFLPGATLTGVDITARDGVGEWGGRVTSLTLVGTKAGAPVQKIVSGQTFRMTMGASTVRSSLFTIGDSSVLRWIKSAVHSTNSSLATHTFGRQGSTPLMGDWDGDGDQTPAVLDVIDGEWRWRMRNANTVGTPDLVFRYGPSSCRPVAGDWNGDGTETPGLVCPSNGQLLWRLSNTNAASAPTYQFRYGPVGARPVVGDWDGDGDATIGVVQTTSTNELLWQLRNALSSGAPSTQFRYGSSTDRPVVGDWDGVGATTVGVARVSGERWLWLLRNSNSAGASSPKYRTGLVSGQATLTGDWDGNGTSTPVMVD